LLIIGKNEEQQLLFKQFISPGQLSFSKTLTNGIWKFSAIGFKDGNGTILSGEAECSQESTHSLEGQEEAISVNLNLSKPNCSNINYSYPELFNSSNNEFKPIKFSSCANFSPGMTYTDQCNDGSYSSGNISSIKFGYIVSNEIINSSLISNWSSLFPSNNFSSSFNSFLINEIEFGPESSCLNLNANNEIATNIKLPLGNNVSFIKSLYPYVKVYENASCDETGLKNITSIDPSNNKIEVVETSSDVAYFYFDDTNEECSNGGASYFKRCFYLGDNNQSCDDVCAIAGGSYNTATEFLASISTSTCDSILTLLGESSPTSSDNWDSGYGYDGFGCFRDNTTSPVYYRNYTSVNSSFANPVAQRVCSCHADLPGAEPLDNTVEWENLPGSYTVGNCSTAMQIKVKDSGSTPYNLLETKTFALSTGNGSFYSDATCTTAISNITITAGSATSADIYYSGTTSGTASLNATPPIDLAAWNAISGSFTRSPGPPTQIELDGAPTVRHGYCGGFWLKTKDAYGNLSPVDSALIGTATLTATNTDNGLVGYVTPSGSCASNTVATLNFAAGDHTKSYVFIKFIGGIECESIDVTASMPGLSSTVSTVTLDNSPYGECP
ncbi:hypothetical protein N9N67_12400, partial [Bacteriovoracaceae bacterium]|nr:hypothetical protein [Bacteriovoracaceae bacterium]